MGSKSPDARTVFFAHGSPGSRLDPLSFLVPEEGVLEKLNLRLVSVDRPGFGASTSDPDFCSSARRLLRLADFLSVDRFAVVGVSGGTWLAAACGTVMPATRLVGIMLHGAAWQAMPNDPDPAVRRAMKVKDSECLCCECVATCSVQCLICMLGCLSSDVSDATFARIAGVAFPAAADAQTAAKDKKKSMHLINHSFVEAFRQPRSASLAGREEYEYNKGRIRMGFRPEDVKCKVVLVGGAADVNVPPGHFEFWHRRLPNSELHLEPGHGHVSLLLGQPLRVMQLVANLFVAEAERVPVQFLSFQEAIRRSRDVAAAVPAAAGGKSSVTAAKPPSMPSMPQQQEMSRKDGGEADRRRV